MKPACRRRLQSEWRGTARADGRPGGAGRPRAPARWGTGRRPGGPCRVQRVSVGPRRNPSWGRSLRRPRAAPVGDLAASFSALALAAQVVEDLGHDTAVDFVVAADLVHDWRFR